MAEAPAPETALAALVQSLTTRKKRFALVGGLAVSIRAEVRFTRDVDVAVAVEDDAESERLIYDLRQEGYEPIAVVEHETAQRLSTARLKSPSQVVVDLMFASTGIEEEITARASVIELPDVGSVPVARPEELLAMKVLSMSNKRLQDRLDAQRLVQIVVDLDLEAVEANLDLMTTRGYHRDQNLRAKLANLLERTSKAEE